MGDKIDNPNALQIKEAISSFSDEIGAEFDVSETDLGNEETKLVNDRGSIVKFVKDGDDGFLRLEANEEVLNVGLDDIKSIEFVNYKNDYDTVYVDHSEYTEFII